MNTTTTSSGNANTPVKAITPRAALKPFAHALTIERFGISSDTITFNGTPLFTNGQYTGNALLPEMLRHFQRSNNLVDVLVASFYESCEELHAIYTANKNTFSGTLLEQHFRMFREQFSAFPVIELEIENETDEPVFLAFCDMLIGFGFVVTFEPKALVNPSARLQRYADSCPPMIRYWCAMGREQTTVIALQQWLTDFVNAIRGHMPAVTTPVVAMAG